MKSRVRKKYSLLSCIHFDFDAPYFGGETENKDYQCNAKCLKLGIVDTEYHSLATIQTLEKCKNCKHFRPLNTKEYVPKRKYYRRFDREYRKWCKEQENNQL